MVIAGIIHYLANKVYRLEDIQRKRFLYFKEILDKPINVLGDSTGDVNTGNYKNMKELQIKQMYELDLEPFVGKKVEIKGEIEEHEAGGDYTDVFISLHEIKLLKK